VAAGTASIRLATTSYLLPLRHPLQAAEQVAVLDQLSGGRVILGVGRGYAPPMLRAFNVSPRDKRSLFESCLLRMISAWSGEPLEPDSEAPPIRLGPRPVQQPHPPVWVAAFGPKALAQAGRLGLPYLASPMETLDVLELNHARYRAAVAEAGQPQPPEVPVMRALFVTETAAETRAIRLALAEQARANPRIGDRILEKPAVEDWSIVGEAGYVREVVDRYRERLGMTHLIVTRLREGGIDLVRMTRSVVRTAEVLSA